MSLSIVSLHVLSEAPSLQLETSAPGLAINPQYRTERAGSASQEGSQVLKSVAWVRAFLGIRLTAVGARPIVAAHEAIDGRDRPDE